MVDDLAELQRRRAELLQELGRIGTFRTGSISMLVRRCGKPGCRCADEDDPGHGPNMRLTYKVDGKTRSQSLSTPGAVKQARDDIARFRRFQRWTRDFTEVNTDICRVLAERRSADRPAPS